MKKIAIPVSNGKLSEYLEKCDYLQIFNIGSENSLSEKIEKPVCTDITKLPEWAAGEGITDVIAFKTDKRIICLFALFRINLFVGIPPETPLALLKDYINGKLMSDERIINEIMEDESRGDL
ncbi:MAG: hypothetical protein JW761_00245 [Prolixibacteraceae bacterium]|nr:hypothetical protein [Prolixibacteraceae bacterium]